MNTANSLPTDDLLRRVCAEYTEMPGLRVTPAQAQRLWGLDAVTCGQVLDCLVDARFLRLTPSGHYARLTEGATSLPDLQIVKALLQATQRQRRAG